MSSAPSWGDARSPADPHHRRARAHDGLEASVEILQEALRLVGVGRRRQARLRVVRRRALAWTSIRGASSTGGGFGRGAGGLGRRGLGSIPPRCELGEGRDGGGDARGGRKLAASWAPEGHRGLGPRRRPGSSPRRWCCGASCCPSGAWRRAPSTGDTMVTAGVRPSGEAAGKGGGHADDGAAAVGGTGGASARAHRDAGQGAHEGGGPLHPIAAASRRGPGRFEQARALAGSGATGAPHSPQKTTGASHSVPHDGHLALGPLTRAASPRRRRAPHVAHDKRKPRCRSRPSRTGTRSPPIALARSADRAYHSQADGLVPSSGPCPACPWSRRSSPRSRPPRAPIPRRGLPALRGRSRPLARRRPRRLPAPHVRRGPRASKLRRRPGLHARLGRGRRAGVHDPGRGRLRRRPGARRLPLHLRRRLLARPARPSPTRRATRWSSASSSTSPPGPTSGSTWDRPARPRSTSASPAPRPTRATSASCPGCAGAARPSPASPPRATASSLGTP